MKRVKIIVRGSNVQRCGFRHMAWELAKSLKLSGSAAYIEQHLEIEAEGNEELLNKFIEFAKHGPKMCDVDEFEIEEIPVTGIPGFNNIPGVRGLQKLRKAV